MIEIIQNLSQNQIQMMNKMALQLNQKVALREEQLKLQEQKINEQLAKAKRTDALKEENEKNLVLVEKLREEMLEHEDSWNEHVESEIEENNAYLQDAIIAVRAGG